MIDRDTIQTLQWIVAQMTLENACQNPIAFAGAILDMCRADDVKLLTNVLRAHYGGKLMAWFIDGHDDAATWAQQKAFLLNESGMSTENVEAVLDALWQAVGWQRPKPSQPEPEPAEAAAPKVDPKYKKEYIDTGHKDVSASDASAQKVDPKYKKEYIDTGHKDVSASGASAQKVDAGHAAAASVKQPWNVGQATNDHSWGAQKQAAARGGNKAKVKAATGPFSLKWHKVRLVLLWPEMVVMAFNVMAHQDYSLYHGLNHDATIEAVSHLVGWASLPVAVLIFITRFRLKRFRRNADKLIILSDLAQFTIYAIDHVLFYLVYGNIEKVLFEKMWIFLAEIALCLIIDLAYYPKRKALFVH